MSLKQTLIAGAIGAAAVYGVRKIMSPDNPLDAGFVSNNQSLPIIGQGPMVKNSITGAIWAIPAAVAFYLSR